MKKLNTKLNARNVGVSAYGDPKGITLISLVITIVILIILAGVAINMTLGENGIFKKAQEAKRLQKIATAKEQIGTEILSAQVEAIERNEELEQAQIEDIISKYGELQEDGDTIILKDNDYEVSLLEIYNGTTTTTGSYTENKAKIALLESQVELLEKQKADLQQQLEDLASSGGDQAQKIVELTAQIQTLEQEKNTAEQNLITANAKVEEYENLKETLAKTTVTEDKILKDYKAYKDGQLITGTMENYAGTTQDATVTSDDTYTYLSIPSNGYYTTSSKLRMENGNSGNTLIEVTSKSSGTASFTCNANEYFIVSSCDFSSGAPTVTGATIINSKSITTTAYTYNFTVWTLFIKATSNSISLNTNGAVIVHKLQ